MRAEAEPSPPPPQPPQPPSSPPVQPCAASRLRRLSRNLSACQVHVTYIVELVVAAARMVPRGLGIPCTPAMVPPVSSSSSSSSAGCRMWVKYRKKYTAHTMHKYSYIKTNAFPAPSCRGSPLFTQPPLLQTSPISEKYEMQRDKIPNKEYNMPTTNTNTLPAPSSQWPASPEPLQTFPSAQQ